MKMRSASIVVAIAFWACAGVAGASPISISVQLTGDPRLANPDNLDIDVTITGDTTSNVTLWTVDLDMAVSHPSAKLDEFGFNLLGGSAAYTAGSISPAGWTLALNDNLQGSGNAIFAFTLSDPPGSANNVTNSVNLTFAVTKLAGFFAVSDFLTAPSSCSNDTVLGCGQLGAHIQSLNAAAGQGDSGAALGNYGSIVQQVPEPATLPLIALGLFGLAATRRRVC